MVHLGLSLSYVYATCFTFLFSSFLPSFGLLIFFYHFIFPFLTCWLPFFCHPFSSCPSSHNMNLILFQSETSYYFQCFSNTTRSLQHFNSIYLFIFYSSGCNATLHAFLFYIYFEIIRSYYSCTVHFQLIFFIFACILIFSIGLCFSMQFCVPLWDHIPSAWRNTLNIALNEIGNKFLGFYLSENVFISPLSLKDFFFFARF